MSKLRDIFLISLRAPENLGTALYLWRKLAIMSAFISSVLCYKCHGHMLLSIIQAIAHVRIFIFKCNRERLMHTFSCSHSKSSQLIMGTKLAQTCIDVELFPENINDTLRSISMS